MEEFGHRGSPFHFHQGGPFADDIFEAFFRAAQGQQGARSRRGGGGPFDPFGGGFQFGGPFAYQEERPRHRHREADNTTFSWLPLMWAALVIFFMLFVGSYTSAPAGPPEYSLWKTASHSVPFLTADGLPFFLEPGKFDSSQLLDETFRRTLDSKVTTSWLQFKQMLCTQDLSSAKRAGAPSRPPSCTEFDKLTASLGRRA